MGGQPSGGSRSDDRAPGGGRSSGSARGSDDPEFDESDLLQSDETNTGGEEAGLWDETDDRLDADRDDRDDDRGMSDLETGHTEDADGEREGLTDDARRRGGKRSASQQKRDAQGRFVGKD